MALGPPNKSGKLESAGYFAPPTGLLPVVVDAAALLIVIFLQKEAAFLIGMKHKNLAHEVHVFRIAELRVHRQIDGIASALAAVGFMGRAGERK